MCEDARENRFLAGAQWFSYPPPGFEEHKRFMLEFSTGYAAHGVYEDMRGGGDLVILNVETFFRKNRVWDLECTLTVGEAKRLAEQLMEHVRAIEERGSAGSIESVLEYRRKQREDEERARYDVSPIIKRFGTWAVTEYGVECMVEHYPIEWSRIDEEDWVFHMSLKNWPVMEDFKAALDYARKNRP